MGFPIVDKLTGNDAEVVGRKLQTNLPAATEAGFAACLLERGVMPNGTRVCKELDASMDFRARVGVDTLVFNEIFPGTALDSSRWSSNVTTMTTTVAAGYLTLNAGLSMASAAVARVTSYRSFPVYATFPASFETRLQFTQPPVANNVCEWGLFIASGTSAPTDGAYFRISTGGILQAVVNYAGAEVCVNLDFNALVGVGLTRHFVIELTNDEAVFWIDDAPVATLAAGTAASATVASMALPLNFRMYNAAATSAAQTMKIGMASVNWEDHNTTKPWAHLQCGQGGMSYQGQPGGTLGSTSNYTNSLALQAGAAATNTAAIAAGGGGSGLGGQFVVLPTLAAGTDGIISSYQIPAGTASLPGKSLYLTRLRISALVTTALTGGPVYGIWSLAFGHTSVSLATTEAAAAKAPRRVLLGILTFAASAAAGVQADRDIDVDFGDAPVVVNPGEFIQTVLKNVGTVTTAGAITFIIQPFGYWE